VNDTARWQLFFEALQQPVRPQALSMFITS